MMNVWLVSTALSLLLDAVVVEPAVALLKATYSFVVAAGTRGFQVVVFESLRAQALAAARPWHATFNRVAV
jgi:hypothetical protein